MRLSRLGKAVVVPIQGDSLDRHFILFKALGEGYLFFSHVESRHN